MEGLADNHRPADHEQDKDGRAQGIGVYYPRVSAQAAQAGDHVGGAVAEGEQRHAGHVLAQSHHIRDDLEAGTEAAMKDTTSENTSLQGCF